METRASRIERGALVAASDGHLGTVRDVIVAPETGALAYLVVDRGLLDAPVTVAADAIEAIPSPHEVRLRVTRDEASEAARAVDKMTQGALAVMNQAELSPPAVQDLIPVSPLREVMPTWLANYQTALNAVWLFDDVYLSALATIRIPGSSFRVGVFRAAQRSETHPPGAWPMAPSYAASSSCFCLDRLAASRR